MEVYILLALEFSAFLVSWLHFKSLQQKGMVFIPVLLTLVVVSEAVGFLTGRGIISWIKNAVWFNYITPLLFICIFLLFLNNTRHGYWKQAIRSFIGATIALTALHVVLPHSTRFNTLNYTIQAAMIAVCSLHYLYECMNSNSITAVEKNPLFYFALGTMLFYLGTLPLRSMHNYLYNYHKTIFYAYRHVSMILNYIMYGLTIFGILWAKKK